MKTEKVRSERKHIRVRLNCDVIVRDKKKSGSETGRSVNIGLGGMYVRVSNTRPVNSEIEIELSCREENKILVKAFVVRVSNHTGEDLPVGLGVCFESTSAESKEEIDAYVRKTTRVLKALYFELGKIVADNRKIEELLAKSPIQHRYSNDVLKNIVASELASLRLRPHG